jgi:hypothetical protein
VILKPTVLILGAGASNPYGYPLGSQLRDLIVELTAPGNESISLFSGPHAELFSERLKKSDVASIDDFLASNPSFATLGKQCISAALTLWGPRYTYKPKPGTDWYKYLWGRLYSGALRLHEFQRNRLRVITYNYDRSLARYLTGVLDHAYPDFHGKGAPLASAFLEKVIPIVHLHGTLGDAEVLTWSSDDLAPYRNSQFIAEAARSIRIVHDDELSTEYETAHRWLAEAEVVHLLGFGFHETNLRRLDLVSQAAKRPSGWLHVGGTALGLKRAERERACSAMSLGPILQEVDCLEYLREHALLE